MVLDNAGALWLLPLLLSVLAVLCFASWGTRKEVAELLGLDARRLKARLVKKYILAGMFALCLVCSLALPRIPSTGREALQSAGEIALVVDVSASMAAEKDLGAPNRLERSKGILYEIVDEMEALGDVRLSLHGMTSIARSHVPFVGRQDYPYLRASIAKVLGINSVPGSGTSLGRSLSNVVEKFSPGEQVRMIIMLGDGEAVIGQTAGVHQVERDWTEDVIAEANDEGVRVVAVGVGEKEGARIPFTDQAGYTGEYAQIDGVDLVSHLEEQGLREIAERTGGRYFTEGERDELIKFIRENLRPVSQAGESRSITTYSTIAPWFALAALVFWSVMARRHLL